MCFSPSLRTRFSAFFAICRSLASFACGEGESALVCHFKPRMMLLRDLWTPGRISKRFRRSFSSGLIRALHDTACSPSTVMKCKPGQNGLEFTCVLSRAIVREWRFGPFLYVRKLVLLKRRFVWWFHAAVMPMMIIYRL